MDSDEILERLTKDFLENIGVTGFTFTNLGEDNVHTNQTQTGLHLHRELD